MNKLNNIGSKSISIIIIIERIKRTDNADLSNEKYIKI